MRALFQTEAMLLIVLSSLATLRCGKEESTVPSPAFIGSWKELTYDRKMCDSSVDECTSCEPCETPTTPGPPPGVIVSGGCATLLFELPNSVKEYNEQGDLVYSGVYVHAGNLLTVNGKEYTWSTTSTELHLSFIETKGGCTQTNRFLRN